MGPDAKVKVLMPKYLTSFKCIGPDCEDTCCAGYSNIDIDQATYEKYLKIEESPLKEMMQKHISPMPLPYRNEGHYARFTLDSQSRCPFLNKQQLCTIQLQKGEEYLSKVCSTYPRTLYAANGQLEMSAVMSCPEAARLALLNEEGMEFVEVEESHPFPLKTKDPTLKNTPIEYYLEMRAFTLDLLKNRNLLLWERLILLGFFFQKAEKLFVDHQSHLLPPLIESFTGLLHDPELKSTLANLPVSTEEQFSLLLFIMKRQRMVGFSNRRYEECFEECMKGVQSNHENYSHAFKNYFAPFMNQHEYILENYLVHYVFHNKFPIGKSNSVFGAYVLLVIQYALVKMHLIGIAAYHKKLTKEIVVKLIQSFSKTVEHQSQYIQEINGFLERKGIRTMEYMTILIKN